MEPKSEVREGLLSRLPQPANLAGYRKEVAELIDGNEKKLRREKFGAGATWISVVALSAALFWGGGGSQATGAAWRGAMACFWLVFGAVELLKYFINRARVELLRETKQVQLQVLELHALMRAEGK
jgi:hypothetical protein